MGQAPRPLRKGGSAIQGEKSKLSIRFHNPNAQEKTIAYIMEILIKSNQKKLDLILQKNDATKREKEA